MRPQPERLLEENRDDGLRYTEERDETKLSFPRRRCRYGFVTCVADSELRVTAPPPPRLGA